MTTRSTVLVVDAGAEPLTSLAQRLAQLGFHALRAKTTDQALETLSGSRYDVRVVVLPYDLPVFDLERALQAFRDPAALGGPTLIAAGARPDADRRALLGRAGVELALWNPVDNHTLRFQLNSALAEGGPPLLSRGAERVPTNWPTHVHTGMRSKQAKIYSLSARGAFLSTASPSMPNSRITMSVPLPDADHLVTGNVVMTNVPGNLIKANLPIGMGVAFGDLGPELTQALEAYTRERSDRLRL